MIRYYEGYWRVMDAENAPQSYGHYKQRFDPRSPVPKAEWELSGGSLPLPTVQLSWVYELTGTDDVVLKLFSELAMSSKRSFCLPDGLHILPVAA